MFASARNGQRVFAELPGLTNFLDVQRLPELGLSGLFFGWDVQLSRQLGFRLS